METLNGAMIFWFAAQGMTTGWILGYIVGHEGVSLTSNMIWGTAGSLLIGTLALYMELSGALAYSFMGTLAILFIANVFHLHHVEDVNGDIDRGLRIKRKKQ